MMTRVVMIEIEGDNKNAVDRVADLLQEEAVMLATFITGTMEHFADAGRTLDDPPAIPPVSVKVSNTLLGRVS